MDQLVSDITLFEFVVRGYWEALISLFSTLLFCNVKVKPAKLGFLALAFATIITLIRKLPIAFGVHTLLILCVLNIILVSCYRDVHFDASVKATCIFFVILLMSEGINTIALSLIFKDQLSVVIQDLKLKTLYMLPSLFLLLFGSLAFNKFLRKRKESQK